jgi:hypothetical protein
MESINVPEHNRVRNRLTGVDIAFVEPILAPTVVARNRSDY